MPAKSAARAATTPSDDAIRTRAYLMWEADGRPDGHAEHYWDRASAELTPAAKPRRSAATRAPAAPEVAEEAPKKPKTTKPGRTKNS